MLNSPEEKILNGLLDAVSERQQILANNISGARVEGYQGRDIDFNIVMSDLRSTNPIDKSTMLSKATVKYDGTPISLEDEMSKMYKNHVTYVLLTRINGHIYQHMEEATQAARAG